MKSLLQIVKKNFKVLIRSKSSALIVILGPLLLIFILGLAFDNSNTYALNIGTYSTEYNDLTNSFVQKLQEKEFNVQRIDTSDECVHNIKEGLLHACIIFPKDLSMDKNNLNNEIEFYVDYSRINMIYIIIETLTSKVSLQSKELSINLTNILLDKLEATRVEIFNQRPIINNLIKSTGKDAGKVIKVQSDLDDIDLKVDTLPDFESTVEGINEFSSIEQNIRDKVRQAKADIEIARSQYESGDNGDATAERKLRDARDSLDSITQNLTSGLTGYSENIDHLSSLYGDISKNILTARKKLDVIDVTDVHTSLLQSEKDLTNVLSSFDKIDDYIGSIQVKDADDIVSPVRTSIKAVTSETTHLNYLFPSLIVLVVMFVSIVLGSTLVMMERHTPAYFRNALTPVPDVVFVLATYITNLFIVLLQIVIINSIAILFFKSQILPTLHYSMLALVLITTLFSFIGMIIGYMFNSEETSTLAAISIGSIFLFFSNLLIPLESIPSYLTGIVRFNPFILSESLLKKIIIYQPGLANMITELGTLGAMTIVLFIILLLSEKLRRHKLIFRIKKHKKKMDRPPERANVSKRFVQQPSKKSKNMQNKSTGLFRYLKK